jgi:hypothetical protein
MLWRRFGLKDRFQGEEIDMNDRTKDAPRLNPNLFTENFNKFPPEEFFKYAGQYTGWSLDGTHILASGAHEVEMEQRLREKGIDPAQVVGMYIPRPEETSIVGGLLSE